MCGAYMRVALLEGDLDVIEDIMAQAKQIVYDVHMYIYIEVVV